MSFQHAEFATDPAVIHPDITLQQTGPAIPVGYVPASDDFTLNQAEFASMVSGERVATPGSDLPASTPDPHVPPASSVVTPVAEKPLEKPLHYDLKLPQPVIYKPLLFSKKVKRVKGGGKKNKK